MQPAKQLREPSPNQPRTVDREHSQAGASNEVSPEGGRSGPFVERRRHRPAGLSWEDALGSLEQHLRGYQTANQRLQESEGLYRSIIEEAPIGIFQISPEGRPLRLNGVMARIFGYESLDAMMEDYPGVQLPQVLDPNQWADWERPVAGNWVQNGLEVHVACPNGETKWIRLNVRAVLKGGDVAYFEGTGEDITERKQIEVRNQLLAYYDRVTGLPNRTLFSETLDEAIEAAKAGKGEVALLLIRIDRFKIINDSLGPLFGDRLLNEIAERIKAGAGEKSTVARVAGAEFAVILPAVGSTLRAQEIGSKIAAKLSCDFTFLGHCMSVQFHMGISIFPEHGGDWEILLKRAEVAMRAAQEEGSNNLRFFTIDMSAQMLERQRVESGLRMALTRNELFLVYQPQVDSRTGALTGLEALLRWEHPDMGLIPPTKFIGVAENTGLIIPIGEWVLRTACAQARRWQDEGLAAVPVAVNVSALQFRQQRFCDLVREVLQETGLSPKYLELELTESLLLTNADVMFSMIQELKEMGVMLAIDDFGTGYSSLGYLRQFKVNRLKISRSFVQDVSTNPDDAAIATAIIDMARALNLDVLAEGVENEEQLAFLQARQCFGIQGFYFSRPVKDEPLLEILRTGYVGARCLTGE